MTCGECASNYELGRGDQKLENRQAVKLLKLVTDRFEGERAVYNNKETKPDLKEHAMFVATTLQGMLDESEIDR